MSDFEFTITETSSMVDLEEYFNYLIIERCNEIYYKIINHNVEYQNLQAEIEGCFGELLQALPEPKHQKIVTEKLWSIIGALEALLPGITYKQAFKDGVSIKKLIFERIRQIDEEIIEADPEYKKLGERPDELLELIAAKLSPEDNELLKEYDDKYFEQVIRRDELFYSRGLMEGIILCYWVLSVGRGEAEIEV